MIIIMKDYSDKLFGINAELLIDHAWGWEPCTIAEIKSYKPENNSICSRSGPSMSLYLRKNQDRSPGNG